jgi:hypothetical protein
VTAVAKALKRERDEGGGNAGAASRNDIRFGVDVAVVKEFRQFVERAKLSAFADKERMGKINGARHASGAKAGTRFRRRAFEARRRARVENDAARAL